MKWSYWIESLILLGSFILLQTTKKPEEIVFFANENDDSVESVYYTNLTIEERIVLIPMHLSKSLNNAVGFIKTVTTLFRRIFVENEVTSVYNLAIMSEIYTHGILAEEHFEEMIYCVIGYPKEEE